MAPAGGEDEADEVEEEDVGVEAAAVPPTMLASAQRLVRITTKSHN